MAKYRHRIFEMFDFREEAIDALTPKGISSDTEAVVRESWSTKHLTVTHSAPVTHVRFKSAQFSEDGAVKELCDEFGQLADFLVRDSKVLLDFEGVESFNAAALDALALLKQRLRTKGSRIALCCLEPAVRQSFFGGR